MVEEVTSPEYTEPEKDAYHRFKDIVPELKKPSDLTSLYKEPEIWETILRFSTSDTQREVDTLAELFEEQKAEKVLDIACGTGRHSIPLAKKGFGVVGVDYSTDQLRFASEKAKRLGQDVRFVGMDANRFSFKEGSFDAAYCLFSTIGEEPLNYEYVIEDTYRAIKPGGYFMIDNYNWALKEGKSRSYEGTIDDDKRD